MFKISKKIIIPISIIIVFAIAGFGVYFGVKQYQNYQTEKIEKEKETQEIQQKKDSEVEKLKQEVEALKNKPAQVIIKNIPVPEAQSGNKLSSIIKQWQSIIVYIRCDFYYKDSNEKYLTQAGSGILERKSFYNSAKGKYSAEVNILTNKHVVLDEGIYTPKNCTIEIPGYPSLFVDNSLPLLEKNVSYSGAGYDWALIEINNPPDYIKNIAHELNNCKNEPSVGDEIAVLGYPTIGSKIGITATEGIISGFDGDYYITSAKVEHGNSGGAAILIKDSCYLGIPTFAQVGEVESLARILKADAVFK